MSKTISAIALAAMVSTSFVVPAAEAGGRHHGYHHRHHHHHHYRGHRHGHWHNGKWIALGIIGATVGAAIADSQYDCYYRHGRRYCR